MRRKRRRRGWKRENEKEVGVDSRRRGGRCV
jgi:hypothetical protein